MLLLVLLLLLELLLLVHLLHQLRVVDPLVVRSTFGRNGHEPQEHVLAEQMAHVGTAASAIVVAAEVASAAAHVLDVRTAVHQQVRVEGHHVRDRRRVAEQQQRVEDEQRQVDDIEREPEVDLGRWRAAKERQLDGRVDELDPARQHPAEAVHGTEPRVQYGEIEELVVGRSDAVLDPHAASQT